MAVVYKKFYYSNLIFLSIIGYYSFLYPYKWGNIDTEYESKLEDVL